MTLHPARILRPLLAALVIAGAALPAASLRAQDAAAPAPAAAPAAPKGKDKNLLDYYFDGGFWMHPILALSVVGMSFIIRNFMGLKRDKLLRPDLIPELSRKVAEGDIAGARQICDANPCLFTTSLKGGLERVVTDELDLDAVREGIDTAVGIQVAGNTKFINYVSNIATIEPMLGLLGTVTGMIGAFDVLSQGGGSNAEAMASNISVAMITTAGGLIVAIPFTIVYFYQKSLFGEILSELSDELSKMMNALKTGVASGHLHAAGTPAAEG
jgi:biopolymer transport protein ExbB